MEMTWQTMDLDRSLFLPPLFFLSAFATGQDRSLRVWERGEDLVFVEEEK